MLVGIFFITCNKDWLWDLDLHIIHLWQIRLCKQKPNKFFYEINN